MNVWPAGDHLVFFGQIILRGPSGSDPKIPPKPLVDIHWKILSLIYIDNENSFGL